MTPRLRVVPRRRERALASGPAYPSRAAASSTLDRASSDTRSGRLYVYEAVMTETPASSATCARVTRLVPAAGQTAQANGRAVASTSFAVLLAPLVVAADHRRLTPTAAVCADTPGA